jgi:4-diphosphocytidyl-2-C-methyl-D-erythritol kinase
VLCRAKVNLTLDVLDRRPDGYHNLESVMQSVDLWDTVRVRKAEGCEITVAANAPGIPSGPGNTVFTACALFREAIGVDIGLAASVEKRIPSQAGLGGGSSDAAGTLLALNELFGSPLSSDQLFELAARIGSDVPYFLTGGTALVTGRGATVKPLPDAPEMDLVIVKPGFGVPTPWAYRKLAEMSGRRSAAASPALMDAIRRRDRAEVVSSLSNDFEKVVDVEYPQIVEIRERMNELGAEASLLCGSGAAVFGVFPGPEDARSACDELILDYPFAVATKTSPRAITLGENQFGS